MASLKNRSASAFIWNIVGTLLRQGSSFVISIFLARLLTPEQFGLVGIAMVFINISQVFIDVGFASALIQSDKNTELTYNSVFLFNIFAGLFLTLIFYFSAPLIGNFYGNAEIITLVQWLSLIFIFNSMSLVQSALLRKSLDFKTLSLRYAFSSAAAGALGIIAAFQGLGVYSLVIQQISMALINTISLWLIADWKPRIQFSFKEIRRLSGFSSFVFFDQFISTAFKQLDIMVVGRLFSPATLGFYTQAIRLKDQVILYSTASLVKVFYPVLSEVKNDFQRYSQIYFKVISVAALVSYSMAGVLFLFGDEIILTLFGQKWSSSIPLFKVLILSVCNFPINGMMVNAFMSQGHSKLNFNLGLIRKVFRLIPFVIAYFYGLFYFTIALVIIDYTITILNIYFTKRFLGLPASRHAKKIFESILPLVLLVFYSYYFQPEGLIMKMPVALSYLVIIFIYNYSLKTEGYLFLQSNLLNYYNRHRNRKN